MHLYPEGQVVALYHADKINKFVTIPFTTVGISDASGVSEGTIKVLKSITEDTSIELGDGSVIEMTPETAKKILETYSLMNKKNKYKLEEMFLKNKDSYKKVMNFVLKTT